MVNAHVSVIYLLNCFNLSEETMLFFSCYYSFVYLNLYMDIFNIHIKSARPHQVKLFVEWMYWYYTFLLNSFPNFLEYNLSLYVRNKTNGLVSYTPLKLLSQPPKPECLVIEVHVTNITFEMKGNHKANHFNNDCCHIRL